MLGLRALTPHHLYKANFDRLVGVIVLLVGLMLCSIQIIASYDIKLTNYVALHSILEISAILVSLFISISVLFSYTTDRSNRFAYCCLASGFLGTALLDLLHTLSYQGMPAFLSPSGAEKAIIFWLAARSMELLGLSMLLVAPEKVNRFSWLPLPVVLASVGFIAWIGFYHLDWLPQTFVPGKGLTPFKIFCEYILIIGHLLLALIYLTKMQRVQWYPVVYLFGASCVLVLSELYFTWYTAVNDVFNLMGHSYKIIAYSFIFRGIFVEHYLKPFRDISATKEALAESQKRLSFSLDSMVAGVWEVDWPHKKVHYSRQCAAMLGYPYDSKINDFDEAIRLFRHHHRPEFNVKLNTLIGQRAYSDRFEIEHLLKHQNGQYVWFKVSALVVKRDNEGNPVKLIGTLINISESKRNDRNRNRSERLLRLSLQELSAVTQAIDQHACVVLTDPEGRILKVNQKFCQLSGFDSNELVGHTFSRVKSGEHALDYYRELWQTIQRGDIWRSELCNIKKNGEKYWLDSCIVPMRNDKQRIVGYMSIRFDITQRKLAEAKLQETSSYVRSLIEASLDPLVTINATGKITDANQAAESMIGLTRGELIGTDFSEYFSHPELARVGYERAFQQGEVKNYPLTMQHVSGQQTDVLYNASVYRNQAGEVQGVFAAARDITDQRRIEAELKALNESLEARVAERTKELELEKLKAEAATRTKSEFLSNMSHEIRTPINSILGMAYLALESLPAWSLQQRSYLQKIHYSGEHLLNLISDILDFSKIEAGKLDINPAPFLVRAFTDSLHSMFAESMRQKKLGFAITIDPEIPDKVVGDLMRIQQVLINFIGNAYKFTSQGNVSVNVQMLAETLDACELKFSVSDEGIGLTAEEQRLLFQTFQQADSSITRQYGGTGLGLAISKQVIDLMSGTIGVDSCKGQGSTFWFTLKLAKVKPSHADISADYKLVDLSVLYGAKILLVEDHPFNQQVASELLNRQGVVVTVAENGFEALEWLGSNSFDCVLMDMQMPVMDGLEATRRIRQELHLRNLIIIAMTANAVSSDREKCFAVGMNDFLSKPIKPQLLYATLANWLNSQKTVSLGSTESSPNLLKDKVIVQGAPLPTLPWSYASDSVADTIDFSILAEMIGDQPQDMQRFALKFVGSATQCLLELDMALKSNEHEAISRLAHRIKSPAKMVGAVRFAELCEALEAITIPEHLTKASELVTAMHKNLEKIQWQLAGHSVEDLPGTPSDAEDIRHLRVLVIDDEPFYLDFTRTLLENLNIHQVFTAQSARQALTHLSGQFDADALILDLSMPEMDGVEFLRHVAKLNFKGGIILLSSADAGVLKAAKRLTMGLGLKVLDILAKPVSIEALAAALGRYSSVVIETKKPSFKPDELLSVNDLLTAMNEDQLEVFYQPKVSVQTMRVVGAESLVRLRHPHRGLLGPYAFISVAEQAGLIDDLTLAVLSKSALQLSVWKQLGQEFKLSVNVSFDCLKQLNLPDVFHDIVRRAGVSPSSIILELTESRLMDNFSLTLDITTRLRLKNFGLSIDDFGTGFSTMEKLNQLPFTELKIDRAFVHGAHQDSEAQAILTSSVDLSKAFHLISVAEGVETKDDWDLVAKKGCDIVQGYFVAKPMPANEFMQWKEQWDQQHNLSTVAGITTQLS